MHFYVSLTWHTILSKSGDPSLRSVTLLSKPISRAERMPEDITGHKETFGVGLCTGLFAATAISCAPSISSLVPIGVQIVLMAFRTGAYVAAMADRLHGRSNVSDAWTNIIVTSNETAVSTALREFHESNVRRQILINLLILTFL